MRLVSFCFSAFSDDVSVLSSDFAISVNVACFYRVVFSRSVLRSRFVSSSVLAFNVEAFSLKLFFHVQ